MTKFHKISFPQNYDYVVRLHDASTNMFFGPIENAFPSGKSFSYCIWIRLSYYDDVQTYYLYTYSSSGAFNQFTLAYLAMGGVDSNQSGVLMFMDNNRINAQ